MPIQILLSVILGFALLTTWKRVRDRAIGFVEAILWSMVWIGAGLVVLLPEWTSRLAHWLGVGRGADLILYAAIITLFLLAFKTFMSVDRIERELTEFV